MPRTPRNRGGPTPPGRPDPALIPGLCLLLDAWDCARAEKQDLWHFAVEMHRMRAAGLIDTDLRWLLIEGYAQQAVETTKSKDTQRSFRPVKSLNLSEKSCFILTDAGAAYALAHCPSPGARPWAERATRRPFWDVARGELRLGPHLAKRFQQRAANQRLILRSFEEQSWPPRIDDPLPPKRAMDTRKRLNKQRPA